MGAQIFPNLKLFYLFLILSVMLYDFFIFLPAWLCLFWMVVHWIMARRSRTFPLTMLCLADLTLFFFADSCYETQQRLLGGNIQRS